MESAFSCPSVLAVQETLEIRLLFSSPPPKITKLHRH